MKTDRKKLFFLIFNKIFNKKFLFEKIQEAIYAVYLYDNFIEVLSVFILKSTKDEITLKLRNGYKINVKTYLIYWKRGGLKELSNVFVRKNYSKYGLTLNKNDTVIILGAHVGVFTIYTASKLLNTGKIITVEPSPDNYRLLKKNIELNQLKNVQSFQMAVSKTGKPARLYINESYYEHSLENKTNKFVTVKTKTIHKIFEDHKISICTLLKLDIEGAEWGVFDSLSNKNLEKIRQIAMEYHNSNNGEIDKLEDRLKRSAFKVFVVPSKQDASTGYLYAKRLSVFSKARHA